MGGKISKRGSYNLQEREQQKSKKKEDGLNYEDRASSFICLSQAQIYEDEIKTPNPEHHVLTSNENIYANHFVSNLSENSDVSPVKRISVVFDSNNSERDDYSNPDDEKIYENILEDQEVSNSPRSSNFEEQVERKISSSNKEKTWNTFNSEEQYHEGIENNHEENWKEVLNGTFWTDKDHLVQIDLKNDIKEEQKLFINNKNEDELQIEAIKKNGSNEMSQSDYEEDEEQVPVTEIKNNVLISLLTQGSKNEEQENCEQVPVAETAQKQNLEPNYYEKDKEENVLTIENNKEDLIEDKNEEEVFICDDKKENSLFFINEEQIINTKNIDVKNSEVIKPNLAKFIEDKTPIEIQYHSILLQNHHEGSPKNSVPKKVSFQTDTKLTQSNFNESIKEEQEEVNNLNLVEEETVQKHIPLKKSISITSDIYYELAEDQVLEESESEEQESFYDAEDFEDLQNETQIEVEEKVEAETKLLLKEEIVKGEENIITKLIEEEPNDKIEAKILLPTNGDKAIEEKGLENNFVEIEENINEAQNNFVSKEDSLIEFNEDQILVDCEENQSLNEENQVEDKLIPNAKNKSLDEENQTFVEDLISNVEDEDVGVLVDEELRISTNKKNFEDNQPIFIKTTSQKEQELKKLEENEEANMSQVEIFEDFINSSSLINEEYEKPIKHKEFAIVSETVEKTEPEEKINFKYNQNQSLPDLIKDKVNETDFPDAKTILSEQTIVEINNDTFLDNAQILIPKTDLNINIDSTESELKTSEECLHKSSLEDEAEEESGNQEEITEKLFKGNEECKKVIIDVESLTEDLHNSSLKEAKLLDCEQLEVTELPRKLADDEPSEDESMKNQEEIKKDVFEDGSKFEETLFHVNNKLSTGDLHKSSITTDSEYQNFEPTKLTSLPWNEETLFHTESTNNNKSSIEDLQKSSTGLESTKLTKEELNEKLLFNVSSSPQTTPEEIAQNQMKLWEEQNDLEIEEIITEINLILTSIDKAREEINNLGTSENDKEIQGKMYQTLIKIMRDVNTINNHNFNEKVIDLQHRALNEVHECLKELKVKKID